jgi:AcrR family transcriptional regulator
VGKAALKSTSGKRTAPKEERQQQLIQATIRSVASNGMSDTTMATVAREAGLSQGIINLHFQSKDRLLVETLRFLSEQYREAWEKAVSLAGHCPATSWRSGSPSGAKANLALPTAKSVR